MSSSSSTCRTLVLLHNSKRPVSFWPLSLWRPEETVTGLYTRQLNPVGKAGFSGQFRSPKLAMPIPRVAQLTMPVPRKFLKRSVSFNLKNLFVRDLGCCAYCGNQLLRTNDVLKRDIMATFDHVMPRSRGGANSWQNAVLSCAPCNTKKADATPEEARMPLLFQPWIPSPGEMLRLSISKGDNEALEDMLSSFSFIPDSDRTSRQLELLAV